jgi:hypothetical protein
MLDELIGKGVRGLADRLGWKIPPIVFIVGSILWFVWELVGHASVFDWVADRWQRHAHTVANTIPQPQPQLQHQGYGPLIFFGLGLVWLTVLMYWPRLSSGSLLRRTRILIRDLNNFIYKNEGNVYAIHFGYDAKFRARVDMTFSELAAAEIIEVIDGDWVINPQTQTVKNIRENVIERLERLADQLKRRQSAPRSKLVGELEAAKTTVFGEGRENGKKIYSTNLCIKMRVTNEKAREVTVKRASVKITIDGETFTGVKTMLWTAPKGRDLLDAITSETPIRHAIATTGSLEFTVSGWKRPERACAADVSVTLIDEFDVPHLIRNKHLWIAT